MDNYSNNMLRINLCQMIEDNRPSGCGYCKDKITNIRKQTSYKYRLILNSIPIDIYIELHMKKHVVNYINQELISIISN